MIIVIPHCWSISLPSQEWNCNTKELSKMLSLIQWGWNIFNWRQSNLFCYWKEKIVATFNAFCWDKHKQLWINYRRKLFFSKSQSWWHGSRQREKKSEHKWPFQSILRKWSQKQQKVLKGRSEKLYFLFNGNVKVWR